MEKLLTEGGGAAQKITPDKMLERALMTTFLWEPSYKNPQNPVANRIADLIPQVNPHLVLKLAKKAKDDMKLRFTPLFVLRELAKYTKGNLKKTNFPYKWKNVNVGSLVEEGLSDLIRRPDELVDFLSLYWSEGKQPIAASVKRGLSKAFNKFDEYQLAKWNRRGDIKLRDVLFLTHAKPGKEKEDLFERIANNTLKTPDTWEVALSSGADKKQTWERLIRENKIGGSALLRNLRNMVSVGVDKELIEERLRKGVNVALPFEFILAAKHSPSLSKAIEFSMLKSLDSKPKLSGKTLLVVDVSGSMGVKLSNRSSMTRKDSAISLAIMCQHICESCDIFITSGDDFKREHATARISKYAEGLSIIEDIEALNDKLGYGGIFLVQCLSYIEGQNYKDYDRVIVITDEQDCDLPSKDPALAPRLGKYNYVINVGNKQNGISYRNKWIHIDGWSEKVLDYIALYEEQEQ